MKKAFLLSMILLLGPAVLLAQEKRPEIIEVRGPAKIDYLKVYGGVTFSELKVGTRDYDNSSEAGFDVGLAYERGNFFYYTAGMRYNMGLYELTSVANSETDYFKVQSVEFPVSGGVNFLNSISRFVGLRLFAGVTPAFIVKVGENEFDLTTNSAQTFQLNGQAGIGFDVAFIFVEASYNRGFTNVFNDFGSNVSQVMINFGLRF